MDFHPKYDLLVSGGDQNIIAWEPTTGVLSNIVRSNQTQIMCLKFSPNGLYLLSGGADNSIGLWEVRDMINGKDDLESNFLRHLSSFEEHTFMVNSLDWHPNNLDFASASEDGTIRLWSIEIYKIKIRLE